MSDLGSLSTGGGDVSADLGATATNTGGTNALGGFSFGSYNESTNYTPYIIGAVVLAGVWYLFKGRKK
ncbi:LPXTG cell wall anchor domain-containing protein [Marinomonas foliarum]|uniref:LPXTG-motif cell wall-anchored protein n=1 Tax=Marinomonas foliarum TaxID=491950 RepID=A0A369ACG5_9GAMM|nr:LPXTG cell wall anchor domain-containing protein [Marinomonas foliarum]RCX07050.1 LPXTG-motif cell wall-anchored protein [Marinomonas foliarum]